MSMIGKTLAHYEITTQLGKGGMGEVYQAKDQKLGRDVAIKVLPEEYARDVDRVARFQREAKLLASLNHPNIAAIHGLDEAEGTNFLVLELVEGNTLADQIKRGPIPVEESLKLALQIAEALEAAHEKGVIHRDLKPANIKVTPDGNVKVLDFGLAKAYAGDREEVNLSNSPTLSDMATQQGVILGTAAYMSPEQAKGKAIDKRTDIWAFGCVLYEMLTGQAAFQGEDVTEILAAVVKLGANLDLLPANLHYRVREVITRCLQKEQKKRYRDIGDAQFEIEQVLADPSGVLVQPGTPLEPRTRLRTMLPWVAVALVLGLIIAGVAVWNLRKPEPRQVMRFTYELPEGRQFSNLYYSALAISSDGKQIVYTTEKGLYLRSVDELTDKLIVGSEGSTSQPFFSPDGKWIGYFSVADAKLKKISINGGAAITVCDCTPYGPSWDTENTIIFGDVSRNIVRVSANGGGPESLFKEKSLSCWAPQILPDGKSVLYAGARSIKVQSLKSRESKELFAGVYARYLPTGHIVYSLPDSNGIFAVPFDPDRLEVKGGPVPIVEGVANGYHFAISESGTLVYIPGKASKAQSDQRTLVWVDRKGKEEPIAAPPNNYEDSHLSPDGTKVAFEIQAGDKSDIWIWDLLRETMSRLTFDGASICPLWSADGKRIAFASERENKVGIYWKPADGTGGEEKLGSPSGQAYMIPWSWSKDAKTLVTIEDSSDGTGRNIGAISMEGDRKSSQLLHEKYSETAPQISPDGRWMAYCSAESGSAEVYVRPFPDINAGKWQVSGKGGECPLWAPDGRVLFYQIGDAMMAVAVETEPTFKAGKPEPLFRGAYAHWSDTEGHPFDIHPDGKRFLMMKPTASTGAAPATAGPRRINFVVNWFEELKQRVPVK
jgi:serine/threonine protein kinase